MNYPGAGATDSLRQLHHHCKILLLDSQLHEARSANLKYQFMPLRSDTVGSPLLVLLRLVEVIHILLHSLQGRDARGYDGGRGTSCGVDTTNGSHNKPCGTGCQMTLPPSLVALTIFALVISR